MNFFEQELKKICDKSEVLSNQKYLGSSCIATIDDCKLAKICFNTNSFTGQFDHLDITVINKNGGTMSSSREFLIRTILDSVTTYSVMAEGRMVKSIRFGLR